MMTSINRRSNTVTAVVVVGTQGSGKSATANSFCGIPKRFASKIGSVQVTNELSKQNFEFEEAQVAVVDTPSITRVNNFEEIKNYVKHESFDRVCYALIMKVGRVSRSEIELLEQVKEKYMKDKAFVIFTNVSELEDEKSPNEAIKAYVDASDALRKFFTKGLNYFAIDNSWGTKRKHSAIANILKGLRVGYSSSEISGHPIRAGKSQVGSHPLTFVTENEEQDIPPNDKKIQTDHVNITD